MCTSILVILIPRTKIPHLFFLFFKHVSFVRGLEYSIQLNFHTAKIIDKPLHVIVYTCIYMRNVFIFLKDVCMRENLLSMSGCKTFI